ncbi:MAG: hypothetical protein ACFFCO_04275 [Promethearchaeota archaeon]
MPKSDTSKTKAKVRVFRDYWSNRLLLGRNHSEEDPAFDQIGGVPFPRLIIRTILLAVVLIPLYWIVFNQSRALQISCILVILFVADVPQLIGWILTRHTYTPKERDIELPKFDDIEKREKRLEMRALKVIVKKQKSWEGLKNPEKAREDYPLVTTRSVTMLEKLAKIPDEIPKGEKALNAFGRVRRVFVIALLIWGALWVYFPKILFYLIYNPAGLTLTTIMLILTNTQNLMCLLLMLVLSGFFGLVLYERLFIDVFLTRAHAFQHSKLMESVAYIKLALQIIILFLAIGPISLIILDITFNLFTEVIPLWALAYLLLDYLVFYLALFAIYDFIESLETKPQSIGSHIYFYWDDDSLGPDKRKASKKPRTTPYYYSTDKPDWVGPGLFWVIRYLFYWGLEWTLPVPHPDIERIELWVGARDGKLKWIVSDYHYRELWYKVKGLPGEKESAKSEGSPKAKVKKKEKIYVYFTPIFHTPIPIVETGIEARRLTPEKVDSREGEIRKWVQDPIVAVRINQLPWNKWRYPRGVKSPAYQISAGPSDSVT